MDCYFRRVNELLSPAKRNSTLIRISLTFEYYKRERNKFFCRCLVLDSHQKVVLNLNRHPKRFADLLISNVAHGKRINLMRASVGLVLMLYEVSLIFTMIPASHEPSN